MVNVDQDINSMRLDDRSTFPSGMEQYLSYYGWHFSKAMCEWAVSRMYKAGRDGSDVKIKPYTKEDIDKIFTTYGMKVPEGNHYDCVYIANMCQADFLGSSIPDEKHLALFVKDVLEDADSYEGMPFTRFYSDCIGSGTPIYWEDLL